MQAKNRPRVTHRKDLEKNKRWQEHLTEFFCVPEQAVCDAHAIQTNTCGITTWQSITCRQIHTHILGTIWSKSNQLSECKITDQTKVQTKIKHKTKVQISWLKTKCWQNQTKKELSYGRETVLSLIRRRWVSFKYGTLSVNCSAKMKQNTSYKKA